MLSPSKAMEVVGKMAILKFFPSGEKASAQLAEILCEICQSSFEADRLLVGMLERYNEWPGPVSLRELQIHLKHSSSEWPGLGAKPPVACEMCEDNGHVNGIRCICSAGQTLPEGVLAAMKAFAGRRKVISGGDKKRSRASDIKRVNRELESW